MNIVLSIFLILIVVYFIYYYLKPKNNKSEDVYYNEKENHKLREKYREDLEKGGNIYLNHVISAAVASVMGEHSFRVKKIKPVGSIGENKEEYSAWKFAGRQQSMLKLMKVPK